MRTSAGPPDDDVRETARTGADLLGPTTDADPAYERFARLVQAYLHVPVALVTFVGPDGQRFPGALGLPEPYQSRRGTPLSHSFCQHVVARDRPLVVSDARTVDLVRDNLAIPDLGVIAYAGFPLHDREGVAVGSLCAIDDHPREWTHDELEVLQDLALACGSEIRQREAVALADRREEHARVLLDLSEAFTRTRTPHDVLDAVERAAIELTGASRAAIGVVRGDMLEWVRHADVPGGPPTLWQREPVTNRASPAISAMLGRRPLLFDDAAQMGAAFPLVAGVGGPGAAAFLPLTTSTALLGAIVLRWDGPRTLTGVLGDLVVTLASDASTAFERAQLLESRTDVARTLQEAMLSRLPEPAGVTLEAAYAPAEVTEQVGGDWYDALELSDGGFAVVVGDVTGHDLQAATLMGQLRPMLRSLLWEHDKPPSRVLELLDRANVGTGLQATATAILARLEPPTPHGRRRLTWSNAGHPPPFVRRASGEVERLDARPDLPLGFVPERARTDSSVNLRPGDTLVLYTDGLVERRTGDLPGALDRAQAELARAGRLSARRVLDGLAPPVERHDDVVVLTMRLDDADVTPAAGDPAEPR
ncbi:GAF domain-containing SpoIIE family protein phosphatase [Cellulomonas sp. HZM]|uniref:GAF domain-containing SpoIIE family protein phosphatase n=1 Tax=Cellulomonas sp. HZM TaxID=1454010 RepID=UPI0018CC3A70|nr:SpoIIE family protein phosphatase [Cellulomonas sp. HZM]